MIVSSSMHDVLAQRLLTAVSDSQVVVAPASEHWTIASMWVANSTGTAATFYLNLVAPGDSPKSGNILFGAMRVAANATEKIESVWYVPPSWRLTGYSGTASALTMTLWGRRAKAVA